MVAMPNTTIAPNATEMRRYLARGLSQKEIAAQYEQDTGIKVSRSTIAMAIERYGLKSTTQRPRYDHLIPWKVAPEHRSAPDLRLLRLEARQREGKPVGERELVWLTNWLTDLQDQDAVVMYDPDTEQGFWLVPRTEADVDIVRMPE